VKLTKPQRRALTVLADGTASESNMTHARTPTRPATVETSVVHRLVAAGLAHDFGEWDEWGRRKYTITPAGLQAVDPAKWGTPRSLSDLTPAAQAGLADHRTDLTLVDTDDTPPPDLRSGEEIAEAEGPWDRLIDRRPVDLWQMAIDQ
jgi:hypothetical protein